MPKSKQVEDQGNPNQRQGNRQKLPSQAFRTAQRSIYVSPCAIGKHEQHNRFEDYRHTEQQPPHLGTIPLNAEWYVNERLVTRGGCHPNVNDRGGNGQNPQPALATPAVGKARCPKVPRDLRRKLSPVCNHNSEDPSQGG